MNLQRSLRLAWLICLVVCTVGCDQTSKHLARAALSHEGPVTLAGGLVELRLAENPGSFLSIGALLPDHARFAVFTVGAGVGLVMLATYLVRRARIDMTRFIGLSLAMAGGTGNLIDRMLCHGLVTDFAVLRIGPVHTGVFNIADAAIMAGIGLVIYDFWRRPMPEGPTSPLQRTGR